METIFHEKQEGYLCAQHCLNALLQGPYFNAVDLANFGHQMDEEERIRMAESGIDSEDYKMFLEQPSGNMDDSGYFSVQVISSALKVLGLELIPYNSTEPTALLAQKDPSQMKAYICNYKGHWFTIRKLGSQWFNLNSMLSGPQLISDTYLAMYLAQLLQEGYSIFIVIGTLPQCPADDVLAKNPIVIAPKPSSKTEPVSKGYRLGTKAEADALKAAQAMGEIQVPSSCISKASEISVEPSYIQTAESNSSHSTQTMKEKTNKPKERIIPIRIEGDDDNDDKSAELQRALQLSLQEDTETGTPQERLVPGIINRSNINDKDREADIDESLELGLDLHGDSQPLNAINSLDDKEEDEELNKALQLSLECVSAPPTPTDLDDLRCRRVNHFKSCARTPNVETSTKLNT